MRSRTLFLLVAISLSSTACFKADTRIRVNEDGSGEIESLLAIDIDAALDLANAFATEGVPEVSADEVCADFEQQQNMPEEAIVRPYEEDGFCGVSYTLAFAPDEFENAILDADTGGEFDLRRDGDGWYFESDLSQDGVGGDDLTAQFLGDGLLDDAELTIGVFLPGRVVDHNASYIDADGTAVWEIDLTGGTTTIFVRTEAGETILGSGPADGGGSMMQGLMVMVILLAIIAGVVWLIVKRRNERDAAAAAVFSSSTGSATTQPVPGPPGSSLPPPPG